MIRYFLSVSWNDQLELCIIIRNILNDRFAEWMFWSSERPQGRVSTVGHRAITKRSFWEKVVICTEELPSQLHPSQLHLKGQRWRELKNIAGGRRLWQLLHLHQGSYFDPGKKSTIVHDFDQKAPKLKKTRYSSRYHQDHCWQYVRKHRQRLNILKGYNFLTRRCHQTDCRIRGTFLCL